MDAYNPEPANGNEQVQSCIRFMPNMSRYSNGDDPEFAFCGWYPNKVYTLEELNVLIPDTYRRYEWNNTYTPAKMRERVYDVVTAPEGWPMRSCLHCANLTYGRLAVTKVHPLLALLVKWFHAFSTGGKEMPPFCNALCLRKYLAERQMELMLFLTN